MKGPALVPVPRRLDDLMRLVNLLPRCLRRSAKSGIHELATRQWNSETEREAITSWFYFFRYIDPLPLGLQAFVLQDDEGLHRETDYGVASLFDPSHLQPHNNIELLAKSDEMLREVILKSKERINHEIELVDEKTDDPPFLAQVAGRRRQYVIAGSTFSEVGPRRLAERAKQRFFFILAAEEILDALTGKEPQKKLETTWYGHHSGALKGNLFVENDKVHLAPPVLYSFVVGLQVSRIHKCEICGNYFWAGRKDKKVCSPQCGATKRKRRERNRYMEVKLGDRIPKSRGVKRTRASVEK